jgi:hypothetical protein
MSNSTLLFNTQQRGVMCVTVVHATQLIGLSDHCDAEVTKRWIVHPLIGNVSWVYDNN